MKFKATWLWPAIVVTLALLAACSGIPRRESDQATLDRYLQYSGTPIERFSYLGSYSGWTALGRDKLVVWTGINDAYLLTVDTPCLDLNFANSIGLTSTTGSVSRGFDSVLVRGQKCRIAEIRPVDYRRMREDSIAKAKETT